MEGKFTTWKSSIGAYLEDVKTAHMELYGSVHRLGPDALERLVEFTRRGKMIRGGLVCLGFELFSGSTHMDVTTAGAVVELFQSALLIHDDIMDRDTRRRGAPSLFYQYQTAAGESGVVDSAHLGESLAICVGDIAFFLAFELLAGISSNRDMVTALVLQSARELSFVGIAQMADVLRGAAGPDIDAGTPLGRILGEGFEEDETIAIYRYKTGRYTFSLPLMIGATLAGSDGETIARLEEFGENLGILFQLKDDEIGLFGDPQKTGKPVGSDIREGKKTLYYHYLMGEAGQEERERLAATFGNQSVGDAEVSYAIGLMEEYSIHKKVQARAEEYAKRARDIRASMEHIGEDGRKLLDDLIEYSVERTR